MTRRAVALRLLRAAERAYGDRLPFNHNNGTTISYEFGTQDTLARFIAIEVYELATGGRPHETVGTGGAEECAEIAIHGIDTAIEELTRARDAMQEVRFGNA